MYLVHRWSVSRLVFVESLWEDFFGVQLQIASTVVPKLCSKKVGLCVGSWAGGLQTYHPHPSKSVSLSNTLTLSYSLSSVIVALLLCIPNSKSPRTFLFYTSKGDMVFRQKGPLVVITWVDYPFKGIHIAKNCKNVILRYMSKVQLISSVKRLLIIGKHKLFKVQCLVWMDWTRTQS